MYEDIDIRRQSGARLFLIGLAVTAVVLAAAVFVWVGRRNRAILFDGHRYPGLVALRRSIVTARYIGLGVGIAVFVAVAISGRLGRGLFLAPAAAGTVLILAIMVGQHRASGYARTPGVAAVEHRLVRNYLPRGLTLIVCVLLFVLLAAAAWTTAAASPDDFGFKRAFSVISTEKAIPGAPETILGTSTRSPFPGTFYTSMLVIGLPIVLVLGVVALSMTARRPRNGADADLVAVDDAVRRQTSEGIMAALGLAISLSLLGVAMGSMMPVWEMRQFGVSYLLGGIAFGVAAMGSLATGAWCTVLVLAPGRGMVNP